MEDVLEVYQRPFDPMRPVICMDESNKQLLKEVRKALPIEPGSSRKYDTEYERNGTCNVFMFFEPLTAKRYVEVTPRRTAVDWAMQMKEILDVQYPNADKVVLVMDNLNTHSPASFYKAFSPSEARRLTERLEVHYTPKHGSWLNMAEIELSILGRQCLSRRIPDEKTMIKEVEAWQEDRNNDPRPMTWRFTAQDARIKLQKLYPTVSN
jgi:transposase